jgi:hypothetical protein
MFNALKEFFTCSSTISLPEYYISELKSFSKTYELIDEMPGVLVKGYKDIMIVKILDENGSPIFKSYLYFYKEPQKHDDPKNIWIKSFILDNGIVKVKEYSYKKREDE